MEVRDIQYKESQIGLIPNDWTVNKLSALSMDIGDGIHTTPKYVNDSEYYFINGNNLENGLIKCYDETKCVSNEEYELLKKNLNQRTILMSINGTIGNLAFFNNEKVILGKSAAYINLNDKVDKRFIYFLLQHSSIKNFYENELTGTTIRNLSLKSIRDTPIPLPPTKSEQTAIATALSDTDALIENLEKLIAKKRNIKQGVMQELLTGRKRLAGFNGEWGIRKLGDLAEMYSGGTPLTTNDSFYNGDIPWVVIADMTKSGKYIYKTEKTITETGLQNSSAKLFKKGVILFAMYASIGKCTIAQMDTACNQAILGVSTKLIDTEFLYYYLSYNESKFIRMGQTGTQSNLNKEIVQELKIPFPQRNEQIEIAGFLSSIDNEIDGLEQKLRKSQMIKQGMMQTLLTGKIRLA